MSLIAEPPFGNIPDATFAAFEARVFPIREDGACSDVAGCGHLQTFVPASRSLK